MNYLFDARIRVRSAMIRHHIKNSSQAISTRLASSS